MNQKNKDPLGTKKPTVLTKDQMRQQIRQALASSRGESPQPSGAAPQLNRSAREPETASASTVRPQQRPQMRQAVPNRTAASAAYRRPGTAPHPAARTAYSNAAAIPKQKPSAAKTKQKPTSAYAAPAPKRNTSYGASAAASRTNTSIRVILIVGICLIAVILIVYFGGLLRWKGKFLPHTEINGISVSGMTEEEARQELIQHGKTISLTFVTKDNQEIPFSGSAFGCTVTMQEHALDSAFSESHGTWFTKLFHTTSYTIPLETNYSEDDLRSLIAAYSWGDTPATDAHIEKTADGSYEIVPEEDGNMVDTKILADYTIEQLRAGNQRIDIAASGAYLTAKVKASDLTNTLSLYSTIGDMTITYDMTDREASFDPAGTEVLSADTISQWVTTENDQITVDEEAATAWVTENIANKYDTYVTGYSRTFQATLDGTIDLPIGSTGIYGWKTDVAATTSALISYIQNGESVTVEPEYIQAGARPSVIGSDNTYIEVDLCHQHLWYYVNGELYLESDVVTGLDSDPSRQTPPGAFRVWSKENGRYLGTMEVQGYHTWVDYWMPIDHTGIGLHDLSRSAYGGDIYKTNGSHGCINLPLDVASNIYQQVIVGTPVFITP